MKLLKRRATLPFTIMLILLSLTVQGAYAIEENTTGKDIPSMDAGDMKERSIEMIDRNIKALDTLKSGSSDNQLNDSVDGLLAQLEALKSEIGNAEEEEDILEITNELRTVIEESPEQIKEVLMENAMTGRPDSADFDKANNSMTGPGGEGPHEMNDTMGNESMRDTDFDQEDAGDGKYMDRETEDQNNGLLSGLIEMIKALFQ